MELLIDLVKKHEGFKRTPYFATAHEEKQGKLTIGYGFTFIDNKPITADMVLTEKEADDLLRYELTKLTSNIQSDLPHLNENELYACSSLAFNIGLGNFRTSTLRNRLLRNDNIDIDIDEERFIKLRADIKSLSKRSDFKAVRDYTEFHRWVYQGEQILAGLYFRRIDESKLFKKKTIS